MDEINKKDTSDKSSNDEKSKLNTPSKNEASFQNLDNKNDSQKDDSSKTKKASNEPKLSDKENIETKKAKQTSIVPKKGVKKIKEKSSKEDEKQAKLLAIEKYKDVPLGKLYSDLNDMKAYVDVLNQRRDELLRAKSHANPKVRKEAIQKTIDNTYLIQFKFQEAVFRNHNQPIGLNVVSQNQNQQVDNRFGGDRVMHRSQERTISSGVSSVDSYNTINIFKHEQSGGETSRIINTNSMQNRPGRDVTNVNIFNMSQPPLPGQERNVNVINMQNRPGAVPPPPMAPGAVPPPALQQQIQQTTTTTNVQQEQLNGIVPIRVINKPVIPRTSNHLDIWPLYEKINYIIKNRKQPKILLAMLIIFLVLLVCAVVFFVLWGFAVNWTDWLNIDIGEAFKNLFKF